MRLVAYIDLPSGSAIFQFLIAGLLGVSVAFRSFWRRVWALLTGRRKERKPSVADGIADGQGSGEQVGEGSEAAPSTRRG
jgi:hypothetical protein